MRLRRAYQQLFNIEISKKDQVARCVSIRLDHGIRSRIIVFLMERAIEVINLFEYHLFKYQFH